MKGDARKIKSTYHIQVYTNKKKKNNAKQKTWQNATKMD